VKFEKLSWSYAGVLMIDICIVKNDLATEPRYRAANN
jgi:hypothetical protein